MAIYVTFPFGFSATFVVIALAQVVEQSQFDTVKNVLRSICKYKNN